MCSFGGLDGISLKTAGITTNKILVSLKVICMDLITHVRKISKNQKLIVLKSITKATVTTKQIYHLPNVQESHFQLLQEC